MYYTYYIILYINTGRIISGRNTAAAAAAAAAAVARRGGGHRHDCGKDAAHLLMYCLNQRHDSLLFRHFTARGGTELTHSVRNTP